MKKRKIIVANWKMNLLYKGAEKIIKNILIKRKYFKNHLIICPPFTIIFPLAKLLKNKVKLGAQNTSFNNFGAFTGDINPMMLKDIGCKYVIIGHSERRIYHNETNLDIKKKIDFAVKNKLSVIFCVGESLKTRRKGQTFSFLKKQINQSLSKSSKSIYIAYEPIWAIGSGLTPTVNEIAIIHKQIRKELLKLGKHYKKTKILYGGAVNRHNAKVFLENQEIDGLLLGGASLKYKELLSILTI